MTILSTEGDREIFTVRFCFLINGTLEYKDIPLEEINLRKIPRSKLLYFTVIDQYHRIYLIFLMEGKVKIISNEATTRGSIFEGNCKVLKLKTINGINSVIFHEYATIHTIYSKLLRFCFYLLKDKTSREYMYLQKRVREYEKEKNDEEIFYRLLKCYN